MNLADCPCSPLKIFRPGGTSPNCLELGNTLRFLLYVLTSVSTGRNVPLSLCPGTKNILVLLSRDKGRSKNPAPNSSVPGRPRTKWIKNFQKNDDQISCFRTSFSVLKCPFPVLKCPFLLCPIFSRIPSRILAVPDFGCPIPSRPLERFLFRPVFPLSRDNKGSSVPLSRKVALSRHVGNTSTDLIKDFFCTQSIIYRL